MEPPSTPRPLANVNARARGIPGAAEASPSWALSVRALQPEGSRAEGGLPGLEDGQAAALAAMRHFLHALLKQSGPGASRQALLHSPSPSWKQQCGDQSVLTRDAPR